MSTIRHRATKRTFETIQERHSMETSSCGLPTKRQCTTTTTTTTTTTITIEAQDFVEEPEQGEGFFNDFSIDGYPRMVLITNRDDYDYYQYYFTNTGPQEESDTNFELDKAPQQFYFQPLHSQYINNQYNLDNTNEINDTALTQNQNNNLPSIHTILNLYEVRPVYKLPFTSFNANSAKNKALIILPLPQLQIVNKKSYASLSHL